MQKGRFGVAKGEVWDGKRIGSAMRKVRFCEFVWQLWGKCKIKGKGSDNIWSDFGHEP